MANSNRDAQGRWSSANIAAHTPSGTPNGGAPNITPPNPAAAASTATISASSDPAQRGASSAIPDGSKDNWGGPSQTSALLDRPQGPRNSGGMATAPATQPVPVRDYSAGYRAMGYSGGEGPGQHQVQAPGGRAGHGADLPAEGMPGPVDASADAATGAGADAAAGAGAEAAGTAALGELADVAALAVL